MWDKLALLPPNNQAKTVELVYFHQTKEYDFFSASTKKKKKKKKKMWN